MTEVTAGRACTQASATSAWLIPRACATAATASMMRQVRASALRAA